MVLAQRAERVRLHLQQHPLGLPVLIDEKRTVAKAYGVWHRWGLDALNIARPALVAIDRSGIVQAIYVAESQGEFPAHDAILREVERLSSGPSA